jgi:DNA-binding transcriptional LysR family regulator
MQPKISLDQWRALMAVVDAGGYAQAATLLHKSQSAVSHAVQKLESLLGVHAFEIQGRKAVLTPTGQLLYRRAKALLDEANGLERDAQRLSAGWEAEIRVAMEIIFPTWLLLAALDRFGKESPHTRVEIIESVLGGTPEALLLGQVDMAISPQVPPGFLGEPLMRLRFIAVAHPQHALHRLGRPLTNRDLRAHRHLVVRDSGSQRDARSLSVETQQRWTVSHMATSIQAARSGYGFAWFPEDKIRDQLAEGTLKALPLSEGAERYAELYLVLADPEHAGPGTLRLAQILREEVSGGCAKAKQAEESEALAAPAKTRATRKKPKAQRLATA